MNRVESIDVYFDLIRDEKEHQACRLFTNNFLYPEAIERFINLKRLFYIRIEAGIVFFSDEEEYYGAFFYINCNKAFSLLKLDKPVLFACINNVNRSKTDKALYLEKCFRESGLSHVATMRHAMLEDSARLLAVIEKQMKGVNRIFEKNGFRLQKVDETKLEEVIEFALTIKEIPYYQFPYFTKEEYLHEADAGRLLCVVDREDKVIAARHLVVVGNKSYGWVGIEERYKGKYGIAQMFLHEALLYLTKEGIMMCSWVDSVNHVSIRYHDHIGSKWTGTIQELWIMQEG